jgi:hypothetical protein
LSQASLTRVHPIHGLKVWSVHSIPVFSPIWCSPTIRCSSAHLVLVADLVPVTDLVLVASLGGTPVASISIAAVTAV